MATSNFKVHGDAKSTPPSWRVKAFRSPAVHLEGPGVMEETNPNDALLSGKSLKSIGVLNQKYGFLHVFTPQIPNHPILKRFGTIIFTTHFGVPLFLETPIQIYHTYIYIKVWSSPPPKKWVPFNDPCPYICCFWNAMLSSVPWRKIFSEASHYQWVVPMNCQPCPAVGNGWIFLEVPMKRGFIEKKYWRSKSMTIFYNSMIRIDWWCLVFVFRDHGWNTSTCTLHVPSFYHGLKAIV